MQPGPPGQSVASHCCPAGQSVVRVHGVSSAHRTGAGSTQCCSPSMLARHAQAPGHGSLAEQARAQPPLLRQAAPSSKHCPHEPPQPLLPQTLPVHSGVQRRFFLRRFFLRRFFLAAASSPTSPSGRSASNPLAKPARSPRREGTDSRLRTSLSKRSASINALQDEVPTARLATLPAAARNGK